MSELAEKLAKRRASIEEYDKKQFEEKGCLKKAEEPAPQRSTGESLKEESVDTKESENRAEVEASRNDVVKEAKCPGNDGEASFPIISPKSKVTLLSEDRVRVRVAETEGTVVAINETPVSSFKNSVASELKSQDVTSITLVVKDEGQTDQSGAERSTGDSTARHLPSVELIYISIADDAPLGVTVAAADVNPRECGGLRIIDIPSPTSNASSGFAGALRMGDILVGVNGIALMTLPAADAAAALRNGKSRRLTVQRWPQTEMETGDSSSKENTVENMATISSNRAKKRPAPATGGKSQGSADDSWTDSDSSKQCQAIKKRLIARGNNRNVYVAGEKVSVDYTRQRPPASMAEFLPHAPGGGLYKPADGAFVKALRGMRRRVALSDSVMDL